MIKREIFWEVRKRPLGVERDRFLAEACGNDEALRAQIESLVANDVDDAFLEEPAVDGAAACEVPAKRIGPYELREEIGRGGMGTVYRAEQEQPVRREVALKIIRSGMGSHQVVARFESERQALAMMDHPNIARIVDAGATLAGRPYFVMELVRGSPITEFCDEHRLSLRDRLELFLDVCAAVQHAHQKGVIHRDLKPANVLVAMVDERPLVKVIDFGIAKAIEQDQADLTQTAMSTQRIGTPAYMSPEQAEAEANGIDTRSDIYALGVLLYELLTGTLPFEIQHLNVQGREAYFRSIRDENLPTPSTRWSRLTDAQQAESARVRRETPDRLWRRLRGDLEWVVMKTLEKDRRRRYDTAKDLAQDLRCYLTGKPVSAVAPSKLYACRRFVGRHCLAVVAAALVLAALLSGLGVSLYFYSWERYARGVAEHETQAAVIARNAADKHRKAAETNELDLRRLLYASNMREALVAVRTGDADTAFGLYSAHENDLEMHGWAWRFLRRAIGREKVRISRYAKCSELAVSPDGGLIALGATHLHRENEPRLHTVEVLDARSLEVLDRLEYSSWHGWLGGMRFTPDASGLILNCTWGLGAFRYDLATHDRRQLLPVNPAGFWPTRFTPDENWIVGMYKPPGGGRQYLRCFSALTGEEGPHSEFFETPDHSMICHEMRVSPDGKRVTVSCADRTLRIYSIPNLEQRQMIEVPGHVCCVAWSPNSRMLAAGYDGLSDVDLWEVEGEISRLRTLRGRQCGGAVDLCFSRDGSLLAHSTLGGRTIVWDPLTGEERRVFLDQRGGGALGLAFTADGTTLLSAKDSLKVWDVAGRHEGDFEPLPGSEQLLNVTYSPDGTTLAGVVDDGTVRLLDARSRDFTRALVLGVPSASPSRTKKYPGEPLCFYPDGSHLVASRGDGTAAVYDLSTNSRRFVLEDPDGELGLLENISVSPESDMIATSGDGKMLILWDARTGALRARYSEGIRFVDFSPVAGSRLVAFATYKKLTLLELDSGRRKDLPTRWYRTSLRFSPDGRSLADGFEGELVLREVPSLEEIARIDTPRARIPRVAFSPHGPTIAVPVRRGVRLWNQAVKAPVGRLHVGSDEQKIVSACFSPDGNTLVVSTLEYGVRIFEAAPGESEEHLQHPLTHVERLRALSEEVSNAMRAEREARFATDAGAIKEWLFLGPLPAQSSEDLEVDQVDASVLVRPRVGDKVTHGGRSYEWREIRQADYVLNLSRWVDSVQEVPARIGYAISYLVSEKEQDDVRMLVGCRGDSLVSLNGRQVPHVARGKPYFDGKQYYRDGALVEGLHLEAGINTLVVKSLSESSRWVISVRLTDREGNSLEGLRTRRDPE